MYTSHLYAIRTALLVFPFIAFLFLIPYMIYQFYKYSSVSFLKSLIVYSFIFYFITICFLVMLPLQPRSVVAAMSGPIKDMRFFGFISDLDAQGLLSVNNLNDLFLLVSNDRFMEPLLNVALLIPFGVYLRYYFKRNWFETFVLSLGLSLAFELTQLSGLFGFYSRPHRLFQTSDLMLNSLGGLLGYLLTPLFVFMFPSKDEIDASSMSKHENISMLRRGIAFLIDWALLLCVGLVIVKLAGLSLNLHILIKTPLRYLKLLVLNRDVYIGTMSLILVFFVLVPFIFGGRTIGKSLVRIRLKNYKSEGVSFFRLLLRTSIFYFYINLYYVILLTFLEFRELNQDMGVFGRYLPIMLIVLFLIVFLDWIYSLSTESPLLYERISGVHNVSVYEAQSQSK